jgi:ABC-2 type transport system ATP-binding protein
MIDVRGLVRSFPGRAARALDDVSFSIEAGEIVALAGRNGAGKTTLLDVLSTLLLPSAGTARVAGFDVVGQGRDVRRRAGYAMTGPRGFYTQLTGRHNLEFFAALHPQIPDPRARVAELVPMLDLSAFVDQRVRECSDGMQQRLVLARALLGRPDVLLLDEPTRALDAVARRGLSDLLASLLSSRAVKAVLYSTHDLDGDEMPARRRLLLDDGRLVSDGAP